LKGGFFKRYRRAKWTVARRDFAKSMSKIKEYLEETKTELKHVIWPSRSQTSYYTLIVIVLSVVIAYYLGVFDFIFSQGLQKIIGV
jgi:preprotein translocase subunit SecE